MSAHTPGPWFVHSEIWNGAAHIETEGGCFQILDSERNVLCSRNPWPERADEMRANARLIAAAPDLLEALDLLVGTFSVGFDLMSAEKFALKNARAAIAKATGEQA